MLASAPKPESHREGTAQQPHPRPRRLIRVAVAQTENSFKFPGDSTVSPGPMAPDQMLSDHLLGLSS